MDLKKRKTYYYTLYNKDDELVLYAKDFNDLMRLTQHTCKPMLYRRLKMGCKVNYKGQRLKCYKWEDKEHD